MKGKEKKGEEMEPFKLINNAQSGGAMSKSFVKRTDQ